MKKIIFLLVGMALLALPIYAKPLVSVEELNTNLDNWFVLDIRSGSKNPKLFQQGHIPNAVYSEYGKAGWRVTKDDVVGLLPSSQELKTLISQLGAKNSSKIVIVSSGANSSDFGSAARVYWTFKVVGHENVSILDGGYQAWQEIAAQDTAYQIETGAGTAVVASDYQIHWDLTYHVDKAFVEDSLEQPGVTLVDARPLNQYLGDAKHAKSKKAGTIPSAVNISEATFFDEANHRLKDQASVQAILKNKNVDESGVIVTFCNTGHWAATAWFAIHEIGGHKQVKMYDGSMVGWTHDADSQVELPGFWKKLYLKIAS